jgi:hypothetical protein
MIGLPASEDYERIYFRQAAGLEPSRVEKAASATGHLGKFRPFLRCFRTRSISSRCADAEVHVLDAGHFALDTAADEIAALLRVFVEGSP